MELKLGRFKGKATMNFPKLGTKFVGSLLVKALGWAVVKTLQKVYQLCRKIMIGLKIFLMVQYYFRDAVSRKLAEELILGRTLG